jgi:hypothetical protein
MAIIVVQNLFFMGFCGINIDVIHLFVLFEHQCCAYCLNTNVICIFILNMDVIHLFMWLTHKSRAHNFRVSIMHNICV